MRLQSVLVKHMLHTVTLHYIWNYYLTTIRSAETNSCVELVEWQSGCRKEKYPVKNQSQCYFVHHKSRQELACVTKRNIT